MFLPSTFSMVMQSIWYSSATIHDKYIIIVLVCLHQATSSSHCVGTCYSGQLFPEPKDIFHGQHLNGYSYNNITTDNPVKCYHHCVQDCRCKACQMKDARCELLDEDKTSKADYFKDEPGYVYFDLKQTMYQGQQSHMVPPGVCYNGCCRSQPCMNGGTCVEQCQTPKEKFICKCIRTYIGKICETQVFSCLDVLIASKTPKNGIYWIFRKDNLAKFRVYCAFEGNRAWTLIESFSLENKKLMYKPFYVNFARNLENPPSWNDHRWNLGRMQYFRSKSTLFRATCDFPKRVSLTPDLVIGRLSDLDIIAAKDLNHCERYMFIDIMGHTCSNCTANTAYGYTKHWHFHLDVSWRKCDFGRIIKAPEDILQNTDNFGFYKSIDARFTCTATPQSTTQWWLGEEK